MEKNLNEGRTQIKRQYGQYAKIKVNEKAPIRNKVIGFVGKRFVTEEEMKNFLSKMNEDSGKTFDDKKWFGRNQRYFESFENRGQKVITLSKYGKRVLEMIGKTTQKQSINECVGLFKNIRLNEAFVNPSPCELLQDTLKGFSESDDDSIDITVLTKGYETIAKLLKGNMKTVVSEMEEGEYELCKALAVGLDKRATGGITDTGKRKNESPEGSNVSIVNRGQINSAFTSNSLPREVIVYHIGDIKVDVATWVDGDEYAEFDHVAFLKKDEKKLISWVNKNMSEDDMEY